VAALESKGIVTSVITQNVDRYRDLILLLFALFLILAVLILITDLHLSH
jgi:hypothetical protein